ncbi:NADPH-dependent 2,4-dienoyl-CoA reductase, sulfur reductase [Polaribacter sp. KT25b]|uniref:FAD-dependent oxidoreductase n=1 Tax=Polaribacter sp. KT25b TaxID=1855336 RepID=UPI00087CA0FD|nr:FAD-dependent oxidoreductase [Polaribacter sp. KT25b]SDR85119.1 NADPH-dependent 2,4-dienoyl-CoA reductase, sulfur reductase [Polaribacter sp. KT25b]
MKYIIIGGVAGGATTAARLRRIDENAEIIMLEKGPHISYANCGLPYYIGGVIKDRNKLLVQTPESFNARFNIDIRIYSEVISINSDEKSVSVKKIETDETYTETYDKLILSPGASPIKPPIPGINSPNIFTLRNVQDTDKIKAFVDDEHPRTAVVVGAGFIGLEMAENLHLIGVKVTVVEAASQVMNMMDSEIAAPLHQHFKEKNVGLFLEDAVKEFVPNGDLIDVHLSSERVISADFVILSIGVKPDTFLAKTAGIKIGDAGGIWVDEYLQTSKKDIYAVGDAIEFPHPITGKPSLAFLAGPANKQGRILADNMVYGHKRKYTGSIGTAIAKVFDLTAGITGLTHRGLKALGIKHESTIVNAGSHAGYYPGAMQMIMKISFDPVNGKLLGGQIVGYKGIDKRLDLLATTIKNGGTIYDLQEIEHAYAPPFSSAKDPVNQAGFNAENIIRGLFKPLSPFQFKKRSIKDSFVLDVRTAEEYALNSIDGALHLNVDDIRNHLNKIPKDKKVMIYCAAGLRGYVAARILRQHGYDDVYNLSGGLKVYKQAMAEQSNPIFFKNEVKIKNVEETIIPITVKKIEVDACGLQCPGPILKLKENIDNLSDGDQMEVIATDPGFFGDVESWCKVTGNKLVTRENNAGEIKAVIEKQKKEVFQGLQAPLDHKTIVVFSDDLDKALASFVIANGAASMGKRVTMFFTFWGLNVIKNANKPKVKKDTMGNMFSKMMPGHAGELSLSNMNMGGMGRLMMKWRMKDKHVDALETMIQVAQESGINMIACQMSMDIMGVDKEELLEGVHIGGVANYLEEAEQSNLNLFI